MLFPIAAFLLTAFIAPGALFADAGWLDRCGAVCMEIHPAFGRVADVLDALRAHGFACVCGDHTFAAVDDPQRAEFVWARRPDGNPGIR